MLLIPIGHDRQVTKRLPVITLTLIAFNILVFIFTESVGTQQNVRKSLSLKKLLEFTTAHPDIKLSDAARERLARVAELEIKSINDSLEQEKFLHTLAGKDATGLANVDDKTVLEKESQRLSATFVAAFDEFYGYQYGFVPAYHKASLLNYFSCMFLHGGFLHILGNMLFLFLAGIAMEDAWGRGFYLVFYLAAGVVATTTHAFTAPESKIFLVGASGAIAGLMGAFLVRYFKARIKFFYFAIFRAGTFKAPAYVMLPLWIALELKDTFTTEGSDSGGVAFWAHIGGFFFGTVIGALVHFTGLGKWLTPKNIKRASSFGTGNAIHEAVAHMQEGENDEAIRKLKQRLDAVPNDEKACLALAKVYGELGQRQVELATYVRLIRILLQKGKLNEALQAYSAVVETFRPDEPPLRLPLRDWMALCQHLATRDLPREAAGEYEKLGLAYPGEAIACEALVTAAELRLRLGEYEYAANIFVYVKTQTLADVNLYMRIAEGEAQLSNLLRGKEAA
ncbi:MAG TPA: rhomboid family intramembrane serine protease [Blastocatellia bacterium]|nr:rhomboid family intramembrane serine protease [Blastocatellia bacterium]